jgi:hypothetical protein
MDVGMDVGWVDFDEEPQSPFFGYLPLTIVELSTHSIASRLLTTKEKAPPLAVCTLLERTALSGVGSTILRAPYIRKSAECETCLTSCEGNKARCRCVKDLGT